MSRSSTHKVAPVVLGIVLTALIVYGAVSTP